jgi:hypothetical protein
MFCTVRTSRDEILNSLESINYSIAINCTILMDISKASKSLNGITVTKWRLPSALQNISYLTEGVDCLVMT